jgi:hypothetical protein
MCSWQRSWVIHIPEKCSYEYLKETVVLHFQKTDFSTICYSGSDGDNIDDLQVMEIPKNEQTVFYRVGKHQFYFIGDSMIDHELNFRLMNRYHNWRFALSQAQGQCTQLYASVSSLESTISPTLTASAVETSQSHSSNQASSAVFFQSSGIESTGSINEGDEGSHTPRRASAASTPRRQSPRISEVNTLCIVSYPPITRLCSC